MSGRANERHGTTYRNVVLTAICGLLVLLAMREAGPPGAQAVAAPEAPMVPNAAAQRVQMIEELRELKNITTKLTTIERTMDARLGAIESRLAEQAAAMRAEQKQRGKEGNGE